MSKYDFTLDMDSENSNSAILRNIKPNSKILEVGCAHGRMTKYLKETLNCDVTIVEYDFIAGQVARKWASKSYVGSIGDIEKESTIHELKINAGTFDYIIFADVLEHLRDPKTVLERVKSLLKPNGSIWLSIPNIAHNSVIIDLLNNKFEYRDVGLLDNTHIKFFTESSLRDMVTSCGFEFYSYKNLYNTVENTEFHNSYDDVPEEVAEYLKKRPGGEIYQFIWELKVA